MRIEDVYMCLSAFVYYYSALPLVYALCRSVNTLTRTTTQSLLTLNHHVESGPVTHRIPLQ
jgi:hypothetical protein